MVGGGVGTIVLLLVSLYLGIDPTFLLQQAPTGSGPPRPAPPQRGGVASPALPRKTGWQTSSPSCSPTRRTPGGTCSGAAGIPTGNRSWSCSRTQPSPPAASPSRPSVPFTAPGTI